MPPRRKGYSSLNELYLERDAISLYWRVSATAASWLILGGYLVLPSTFDKDPHLRFSKGALDAIVAILLIAGYSLTLLLFFRIPSWLFQSESLFAPALSSSALGLLGTLYAFASSSRYTFNTSAGVAVALTTSSTAFFAVLLVWVQRKIARIRSGVTTYSPARGITITEDIPQDGRNSEASTAALYQEPNYYRNYIINMHPTAVRAQTVADDRPSFNSLHEQSSYHSLRDPSPSPPRSAPYYDPSHAHSTPDLPPLSPFTQPQIGEEEQVSQHLARLLLNTRDGETGGASASQSTFRIDWRTDDDDDGQPARGIHLRTRTGSGSRLVPPGKIVQAAAEAQAAAMRDPPPIARLAPFRGGETSKAGADAGRGRTGAKDTHRRAKSREDRRREIELGLVGLPPASGTNGLSGSNGGTASRWG